MYDWIIIGGGIHGCTVASFLIKNQKTSNDKLLIIDPYSEPMYRWRRNTKLIGMEYLRSPSVHQIDVDPFSLQKYAQENSLSSSGFYGQYKRPALTLFNEHCETIINEVNLKNSWHQGKVCSVKKTKGIWKVTTENGEAFLTKNIVISISINDQFNIPDWAAEVKAKLPNQLYHIFDENMDKVEALKPPIVIIGGGITAAHLSIKLSNLYPGQVTLVKRHPFRVHDFDSDPGWLGPKKLRIFYKVETYEERRQSINTARNKGSIPKEILLKLKKLKRESKLRIEDGEIQSAKINEDKNISLVIDIQMLTAQTIVCSTGFVPSLPNQQWLKELIEEHKLKCATCGYPIINQSLEWCSHLYVSGPLAELEIGPVSRNISGARMAAERIVSSLNYKTE
ncbi:SidA/IucD/PvdA family monooxygenase [Bacillus luteolus]|uniref:SidA/IucD/PvdA family monooxygenase n=1 Tax=Litchfieldia luteola TaxID=682179 RepID=A0ABR9QLY8_9BACI|nr:FAD/NAD(P)-binding protein [Cytobacillus luteolus]MBE4909459.1 SidA/IucD/PvdA family monooxygenase [Cytobacillus luteolus]MBP1940859.1 lysine/ornithine N-monooxygenase [Cytobacillus luteolus]